MCSCASLPSRKPLRLSSIADIVPLADCVMVLQVAERKCGSDGRKGYAGWPFLRTKARPMSVAITISVTSNTRLSMPPIFDATCSQ